MIAIVGKIGAGKTTLVNLLKNHGHKILVCDDLVADFYKNNQSLIKEIKEKIGNFLIEDNEVSKKRIINWILDETSLENITKSKRISQIEKIVFKYVFRHLKENEYDFVEIPILNTNFVDFSIFFEKIINIQITEEQRRNNLKIRGVNNSLINELDKKNDNFFDKNQFFRKIPIVNISWEKTKNIEEIEKFMDLKIKTL